jgi:hypothetical protein
MTKKETQKGKYEFADTSQMTEQEAVKFIKRIMKNEKKLVSEYLFNCGENTEFIKVFIAFIDKYPLLFADNHDCESRKFLKWVLTEQIKQTQAYLDKITATETKYNLPLEYTE